MKQFKTVDYSDVDFKRVLADGIMKISISLSSTMEPVNAEILCNMVDDIFDRVVKNDFGRDISVYRSAINKILIGQTPFYKLNILAIMESFYIEFNGKPTKYATREEIEEQRVRREDKLRRSEIAEVKRKQLLK